MNNIVVSVICLTYNHEKFLAKALDSILEQETCFPYEIVVHDDASTDNTVNILKYYEEKHNNIKVIYQSENQYSKKIDILSKYVYPMIKGKYIAFCEGDDYWTDKKKLQKQYELILEYPNVNMVAHASYIVSDNEVVGIVKPSESFAILTPEQVIMGGGRYLMTNSLFYKREIIDFPPDFTKIISIDYAIQIWGSLKGGIAFSPEIMSAYRTFSSGNAWTTTMRHNAQKRIEHHNIIILMLETLNKEYDYKYDEIIRNKINQIEFDIYWLERNYKAMLSKEYKHFFSACSLKKKITIRLGSIFPRLTNYIMERLKVS